MLAASEIAGVEPHASGIRALHSPATGTVDFRRVTAALAEDLSASGGSVAHSCEVRGIRDEGPAVQVKHARGTTAARALVVCAGIDSDRLATLTGAPAEPRIVPGPRRVPPPAIRPRRSGPGEHLSGPRPGAALPRRAPDPPPRRSRAAGAHRAALRNVRLARHLAPRPPALASRPDRAPPRDPPAQARQGGAAVRPGAAGGRLRARARRGPGPRRSPATDRSSTTSSSRGPGAASTSATRRRPPPRRRLRSRA